jgi:hypothetical protein
MGPFHVKARGGMSFFPISRRMNDMSVHLLCQDIICHWMWKREKKYKLSSVYDSLSVNYIFPSLNKK